MYKISTIFVFQCVRYYDELNYVRVTQSVEKFINAQLSNFYCHITKDRWESGLFNHNLLTVAYFLCKCYIAVNFANQPAWSDLFTTVL